jgi:type IV secretory pathway TraG/TraD family ATPase VirD4
MAIKRLEQILFERRKRAKPDHDVLLLLDETRRIRRFKAGEYITFARDAKAGCVLVYQSIAQIRSEQEVIEILENVGTQIYLRSLTGATATRFIEMLPKRERPRFSLGSSQGSDGFSKSMQMGQEQVDYLSTSELYRLPAGNYPALVYIKDHGEGKPILVDMDKERLRQSMSLLY